jgi:hypothetical protein
MKDNTTHTYKEQFPTKPITEIKTTNTTQGPSTKNQRQSQNMDNLHI